MKHITSSSNPLIKATAKLQEDSRQRRSTGLFCVENGREIARALAAGFQIERLFIREDHAGDAEIAGQAEDGGAELVRVPGSIMKKIAVRQNPYGLLAVFQSRTAELEELTPTDSSLLLICSGLEKPGNIGAILRTADAAGVAAALIDRAGFDVFNPHCVHASTGAVFSLPIVAAEAGPMIAWLKANRFGITALSPEGADLYGDAKLTGRCALVMGAEHEGLPSIWREAADATVAIPMRGGVDSLNVSVAAAVVMFEAVRRRRGV